MLHAGWRTGLLQALRTARLRRRTGLRGRSGLRRRTGLHGCTRSSCGRRLLRLTRPRWQAGLLRRTRLRRSRALQLLPLPVRRARLLRRLRPTRPVLQAGLLRSGAVLSRHAVLLRSAARRVTTVEAGVGTAKGALLVDDATAEILRRVNLAHKTLVAHDLLR